MDTDSDIDTFLREDCDGYSKEMRQILRSMRNKDKVEVVHDIARAGYELRRYSEDSVWDLACQTKDALILAGLGRAVDAVEDPFTC